MAVTAPTLERVEDRNRARELVASPWPWVALAAAALAAVVMPRFELAFPDDAFITFRYAQNLATGQGWVYNVGEATGNAATSPLWTGLLALAYVVRADMVANVEVLEALLMTATAGLLTSTAVRITRSRLEGAAVGVVGAALAIMHPWLLGTHGMESWLFLALTVAALHEHVHERPVSTGVLAGLVTLTRGEGALLAAILTAVWAWRVRGVPWRIVLGGAAVGLPWLVFAWVALGSPVPDTLGGKVAQGESGFWGEGLVFLRGFREIPEAFNWRRPTLYVGALGALGGLVVLSDRRWWPWAAPLGGLTLGHVVAYGLLLRVPNYHWYYAIEIFALALLGGIGVGRAVAWTVRGVRASDRRRLAVLVAAPAVVLAAAVVRQGWERQPRGFCCPHYREIALWMEANAAPDASIAATEIGVIGWWSDNPVIDYLGLLDPESADELAERDMLSWLERSQPDYWLVHTPVWSFEEQGATAPWFDRVFEPVTSAQDQVTLYRRVAPIPDLDS